MSISTISLIESLLLHDRPAAWWGLDTANPLEDDAVFGTTMPGYMLTAIGAPANNASLHTRGDTGASGARDFNGTTDGYYCLGKVTAAPEGPPAFHAYAYANSEGSSAVTTFVTPGGIEVGDLLIFVSICWTQTATVSTAPPGFTQIGTTRNCTTHARAVYRKTAVTADTLPSELSITWSSVDVLSLMLVYRGCDSGVANLIFDSAENVTGSGTFHSTSSETFPDGARQLVIWTDQTPGNSMSPNPTGMTERANVFRVGNEHFRIQAVEYEQETAGSAAQNATTTLAATLGYVVLTFGSPRKVLNDVLDTIAANVSIGCLVSFDAFTSERTIVRKFQSWGLVASAAGVLQFIYRDGGGVDRSVNGPTLSTSTTYRIWVVDEGPNIRFTVNGTTTTTARTGTAGYTTNANRISIAHAYNGSVTSAHINGRIDELSVFPIALSASMVAAHEQAATLGTFGDYVTADRTTGRYPRAKLELAFDSDASDACYAYTDVTSDVRHQAGIQWQRTRNDPLDRFQAGTMSFVLQNRDGALNDIDPRRPVRWRAQVSTDGPVHARFFGYTEAPRHERPGDGKDTIVSFTATDVFKALSLNKVQETFVRPQEMPGERLEALLEHVGGVQWSLDPGHHLLDGVDLQGNAALEHAQAVAETDGGIFFCDALGRAVFQDNQYRAVHSGTVTAIYGWPGTAATFRSDVFEPEVDESRLYTAAVVTPSSGAVQRAENEAASARYFPLAKDITTLHASDIDALAMAHHIVNVYSVPLKRVGELRLQPRAHSAPATMWATVLAHTISERVRTIEEPIGGGGEISREHFIEGISETVSKSDWRVSLSLSPTELEGSYFVIGTDEIGDTTRVIGW